MFFSALLVIPWIATRKNTNISSGWKTFWKIVALFAIIAFVGSLSIGLLAGAGL